MLGEVLISSHLRVPTGALLLHQALVRHWLAGIGLDERAAREFVPDEREDIGQVSNKPIKTIYITLCLSRGALPVVGGDNLLAGRILEHLLDVPAPVYSSSTGDRGREQLLERCQRRAWFGYDARF